jgi:phenylalanyl-tRNA synthetase alpha chain
MMISEYDIEKITTLDELESLRQYLLGKDGLITKEMKVLSALSLEQKKQKGQEINAFKDRLVNAIKRQKGVIENQLLQSELETQRIDITLPGRYHPQGQQHPITWGITWMKNYFSLKGFDIESGPDIETPFYNFDALNIPSHHPARQSHDTFYVDDNLLLRTHTSSVQIRAMEKRQPPVRLVSMGRVYRSDALDMTHSPMFHQIEGLVIEPGIHMGHLKGLLLSLFQDFFDHSQLSIRFRPSFFPFTEPSAEIDISFDQKKWLEMGGCGMVHPHVLKTMNIDPTHDQGFAFGLGVERLLMVKYRITDIRRLVGC